MEFATAQGVQKRSVAFELRATGDFKLTGYAATYNQWSKNLGGFIEQISPTAFARSLRTGADVKCLLNHAPHNILGRTKSGTLALSSDDKGLRFECQLDKTSQLHKDIYAAVKRGDIDECSFAFMVPKDGDAWSTGTDPETGAAIQQRTLRDVDLQDVSVVTYPAYNNTSVGARNFRSADYAPLSSRALARNDSHGLIEARNLLRRATQLMIDYHKPAKQGFRAFMDQEDFASLDEHLRLMHEHAEYAQAVAETVQDMLWCLDGDDIDDDSATRQRKMRRAQDPLRKALRDSHIAARASLGFAAERCADTRLALGKLAARKK